MRLAAASMLLASPCATNAAIITVAPDGPVRSIAAAASIARDGDIVEVLAGEYRGDVAVWTQRRLTIRGVGGTPVLKADGRVAEGKAIWVIRNGDVSVENFAFEGARADDRNGAGIRFEEGRLTIRYCRFADNENGLLTSNSPDAELTIENSEFSRAPRDRGPFKHLLYVGSIARFTLRGSRFHQGFEGHLVKTRARFNRIEYNLLYDGEDGRAAYELEFPNGGVAEVVGNVIGQSTTTTNPVVVAYGAEGSDRDDNALYLVNNTLISDGVRGGWFLRVWTDRIPGDATIVAVNNLTVGLGLFSLSAPGRFDGNFPVLPAALGEPGTLDFRLAANSLLRQAGVRPPRPNGRSLAPAAEFSLPIGTVPLAARPRWTPGAYQSTDARR